MATRRIVNPLFQVQALVPELGGKRSMGIKLTLRKNEKIDSAVRRFRKLVDRAGITRELRNRKYYEKPSTAKRRDRLRAIRRNKNKKDEPGR